MAKIEEETPAPVLTQQEIEERIANHPKTKAAKKIVLLIFSALLLDLLAFTIPLPLFPRIIDSYLEAEKTTSSTFLSSSLAHLRAFRSSLTGTRFDGEKKWDTVLLGGLLGSIFSFCQYLVSPYIGSLSDRYGRKTILLVSLVGNLASAAVWVFAGTFNTYLVSRLLGGLSEGNVQLSIAAISDVTQPAERSKSLAFVGLAFSLAFTFGPMLGAYISTLPFTKSSQTIAISNYSFKLNIYALPAIATLVMLSIEFLWLAVTMKETKGWLGREIEAAKSKKSAESTGEKPLHRTLKERNAILRVFKRIHLLFLFVFSGCEFTLTFLTYDLLGYTNSQNGRLLAYIGILSSFFQGVVMRNQPTSAQPALAFNGMIATSVSLFLLSALSFVASKTHHAYGAPVTLLAIAGFFIAFASATVVGSLNSMVSLLADDIVVENGDKTELGGKGQILGQMRSSGQLGRALGPIFACSLYFFVGPTVTYIGSGLFLLLISQALTPLLQSSKRAEETRQGTEAKKDL